MEQDKMEQDKMEQDKMNCHDIAIKIQNKVNIFNILICKWCYVFAMVQILKKMILNEKKDCDYFNYLFFSLLK